MTEHSSALDLEKDVFTLKDPKDPLSLKHSAEDRGVLERSRKRATRQDRALDSHRRYCYVNLSLENEPRRRKRSTARVSEKAKDELRKLFGRKPAGLSAQPSRLGVPRMWLFGGIIT